MKHQLTPITLKSGAKGLLIDIPGSTVIDMEFTFLSGFDFVEPKKYEVAHSMEHMIFGANDFYKSSTAFSRELGLNGAYHNAYTSPFLNGYVAEAPEFEWERVMRLFWQGLTTPKFLRREFLTEQETINEELHNKLDNHGLTLDVAMVKSMGDDHLQDYRTRIKILPNITPADLKRHHELTHTAANMRFIVAGNLRGKKTAILKLLERSTRALPGKGERNRVPKAKLIQPLGPTKIKRAGADKLYFDLKSAHYGELQERQLIALGLLSYILTGAWDSRLFGKGRRKGLLYGIACHGGSAQGASGISISGSVVPGKSVKLFNFVSEELGKLKTSGVREAELKRAKQFAIGNFQISHQTPQSLVNWYSRYFVEDEYFDFSRRPAAIKAVTTKDINDLIEGFFGDGSVWNVGVLGRQPNEAASQFFSQSERLWL